MSAICGFAGPAKLDPETLLDRLLGRMRARGSRGTAKRVMNDVGLGLAWAPTPYRSESKSVASSADGTVQCVLDGYLVDYDALAEGLTLKTKAHAELAANLFAKHGEKAFARLDGSFSAAFVKDRTLWVVRDSLGEKPVYFTEIGRRFMFASEIKAFLDAPGFVAEPDPEALLRLLAFSFIPGEKTMFRGVSELLPGTFLRWKKGAVETKTYWDLEERLGKEEPELAYKKAVAKSVEEAVVRRLPDKAKIAAFLSGGIDSSAVVAVLAKLGAEMTAFSIGFGEELPNELGYARMVAEHCDVKHEIFHVHPEGFVDLLPKIIYSLDDPLCDCITVPNYMLAHHVADRGFNLVFNGEGGDPLFGGPKNKFLILREWYDFVGETDRTTAYLSSYHKLYDELGDACTPELLKAGGGTKALSRLVRPYLYGDQQSSFLNRLMYVNVKLKGGQNILVKVDKLLSANGVSVASPLFDRALSELSFAIPPRLKRSGDVEKYIFKKAVQKLLPKSVVYRKKEGMGVPLNQWFRTTVLRGYATEMLLSKRARERGLFRAAFVESLLRGDGTDTLIGQDRSGEQLWMLMAIELWYRVFVDGDGA